MSDTTSTAPLTDAELNELVTVAYAIPQNPARLAAGLKAALAEIGRLRGQGRGDDAKGPQ